jgi:hypothetical protein
VTLARKVCEGLDLTNKGIGVCIVWRTTTLSDLDFDFCCLGFSVVVGLLGFLSCLNVQAESCIPALTTAVKCGREICDSLLRLHREAVRAAATHDMLQNASAHINAAFAFTMPLIGLFKGQLERSARLAAAAAPAFTALVPPQPGVSAFLLTYADINVCRAKVAANDFGVAIAHGRHARAPTASAEARRCNRAGGQAGRGRIQAGVGQTGREE